MKNSVKKKLPFVTVHSLIYNNGSTFEKSLLSLINQTYPTNKIKHIILDDKSTDKSVEIIERLIRKYNHKCTFIRNSVNMGITKSLNKILKICNTKYFAGISDDLWEKDFLEILVKNLDKSNNKYLIACCNFVNIDAKNKVTSKPYYSRNFKFPTKEALSHFLTKKRVLINSPTVVFNTEIFKKVGKYNEDHFMEDFDLWLRILPRFQVMFINKVLLKYRRYPKQVTNLYWHKIIQDCYHSIKNLERSKLLTRTQRAATLIKKVNLVKELIKINIKAENRNSKIYIIKLIKEIKSHPSYEEYVKDNYNSIIDKILIFIFKKNSYLARRVFRKINHNFKSPFELYNIIFRIGNLSKRLDYYLLILISRFRITKIRKKSKQL